MTVLTDHLLDDVGDIIILRLSDDMQQLLHDGPHVWFHVLLGLGLVRDQGLQCKRSFDLDGHLLIFNQALLR